MAQATETTQRRIPLREVLLLAGFLLLVAFSVFSVVIPELDKTPEEAPASGTTRAVESAASR
jgi:hypothetical protein